VPGLCIDGHDDLASILKLGHDTQDRDPKEYMDYFIFRKGSLPLASMPPFIVGSWRWDTWLTDATIRHAHQTMVVVVDSSDGILAIHTKKTLQAFQDRPGAKYNNEMFKVSAGGAYPTPYPTGFGGSQYSPFVIKKKKNEDGHIELDIQENMSAVRIIEQHLGLTFQRINLTHR
jgi:hypothetical protein